MNNLSSFTATTPLSSGIQKTLANTFWTLSGMWGITAIASYMALDWKMGLGASLGLFVAALATLFGVFAFRKSGFGIVLLALFAGLEGLSLGPLMSHYLHLPNGGQLVLTAAGLTAVATVSCAMYCINTRKSFSRLGGFLFAGLIVLLVASLIGIFVHSTMFHLVVSGLACMLFTAFMLYDIGEVVTGQQDNYLLAALGIYLDMLNLFVHLLRILGILSSSDD
jgi:modulator of FtsH protease